MKTNFMLLNKSPYENGLTSGLYFKETMRGKMDFSNYEQLINDTSLRKQVDYVYAKLKAEFPIMYEEMKGKADGLGVNEYKLFTNLCPEIFKRLYEKCTTIVKVKDDGNIILCHNEDDKWIDFNFAMVKVMKDDNHWFVSNDSYDMPWGNGFGYNSYGIVKSINYIHQDEFNHNEYIPRFFAQRYMAEATSLDDLIEKCKLLNASGYHLTALDKNTKKAITIEIHPDYIDVEEIDNVYAHSNHYIHGDFINHPSQDNGSNSIFRHNKALELISNAADDIDGFKMKELLAYQTDDWCTSIFQKLTDPSVTINNFMYDTTHPNDIYLDVYPSKEKFKLDYTNYSNIQEL